MWALWMRSERSYSSVYGTYEMQEILRSDPEAEGEEKIITASTTLD